MTLFEAIRNRRRPPPPTDDSPDSGSQALTDRHAGMSEREAIGGFTQLDQVELTALEEFERSNRKRPAVLNKLRYLRQREPVPGYDSLEPNAIEAALSECDTLTIKAAREYENKLKKRPSALKAIDTALRAAREREAPVGDGEPPLVVGNGLPAGARPLSDRNR